MYLPPQDLSKNHYYLRELYFVKSETLKNISIFFFVILFSFILIDSYAQNTRLSIGVRSFSFAPNDEYNDRILYASEASVFSDGIVGYVVKGVSLNMNYERQLNPRFSLGLSLLYLHKAGAFDKDQRSIFQTPPNKTDYSSKGELDVVKVVSGNVLLFYNLLPNKKLNIKIGAGVSCLHRKHYYRNFLLLDTSSGTEVILAEETFTTQKKQVLGLTAPFHIGYPIKKNILVGLNSFHTIHFNSDLSNAWNLSLGYIL